MKYKQSNCSGFYLRTTKKDVFLGEDLEEAKVVFHTNFYDYLDDTKYWVEYRYAPWLTAYCNSKVNNEEGWTGIDRSADFLRYNQALNKDNKDNKDTT